MSIYSYFEVSKNVLALLGAVTCFYYTKKLLKFLFIRFLATSKIHLYWSADCWAVVTGGSDGIGLAYAKQLLKNNFNVVILGRNKEKLEKVVTELKTEFKSRKVEYRVSNALDVSDNSINEVINSLQDKKISVLINNVGVSGALLTDLENWPTNEIESTIAINCTYTVKVTKAFIPLLKRQKQSLIMVLASIGGLHPAPSFSVYSASKAFDKMFGLAIAVELQKYGIDVQVVEPGYVISNFSPKKAAKSWIKCTPEEFAEASIRSVGWERESIPYFSHTFIAKSLSAMNFLLSDAKYYQKLVTDARTKAKAN